LTQLRFPIIDDLRRIALENWTNKLAGNAGEEPMEDASLFEQKKARLTEVIVLL
jgi:hypothetical protein